MKTMRSWKKRIELCCVSSLNSHLVKAVVACDIKSLAKVLLPTTETEIINISAANKCYKFCEIFSIDRGYTKKLCTRAEHFLTVVTFEFFLKCL